MAFVWYLNWSRDKKASETVKPAENEADVYFRQFKAMIA
jgi:hypothetical protein